MSDLAQPQTEESTEIWRPRHPLATFFGIVGFLFVLRVVIGIFTAPLMIAQVLTVLSTAIFILLPIWALFNASAHRWKASGAWILTLCGAIVHGGLFVLVRSLRPEGLMGLLAVNGMQAGMLCWTAGLGILVAILIKERNMLLPVALFLAGMDAFLILMPYTPQAQIAAQNPEIVGNLGLRVPAVRVAQPGIPSAPIGVNDIAFVGPADLFISAMFFAALFRYRLRPKQTAVWLGPVLVIYLFVVLLSGIPLPALVPIGLTVLAINLGEFQLSREEKQATAAVFVIAVAMAGYGLYAKLTYKPPAPQADSLMKPDDQALPEPSGNLTPVPADPRR